MAITVTQIPTRRFTRVEYERLIELDFFQPGERLELIDGLPDAAVVAGDVRDYRDAHPEHPVLVVEVAESRLGFDRRRKSSLYARAGIADYWVLNLPRRVLEVHREPEAFAAAPYGFRYRSIARLGATATVSPLAAPSAVIAVADLLP